MTTPKDVAIALAFTFEALDYPYYGATCHLEGDFPYVDVWHAEHELNWFVVCFEGNDRNAAIAYIAGVCKQQDADGKVPCGYSMFAWNGTTPYGIDDDTLDVLRIGRDQ